MVLKSSPVIPKWYAKNAKNIIYKFYYWSLLEYISNNSQWNTENVIDDMNNIFYDCIL
jgi:hypothetical protein